MGLQSNHGWLPGRMAGRSPTGPHLDAVRDDGCVAGGMLLEVGAW